MKKAYHAHEIAYKRLKQQGLKVWGQKNGGKTAISCRAEISAFVKDALAQKWTPKAGRVIELGCGTGPILRQVCKKGFIGLGIDVSRTAISMAREQSQGMDIEFKQADICNIKTGRLGKFDIVIDGLCLHCITNPTDRKAYLANVCSLLEAGGMFILLTMCGPINRTLFHQRCEGHKLIGRTIYVPCNNDRFESITFSDGRTFMPTRYIAGMNELVREVRKAGLHVKLLRYNADTSDDICGTLTLAATR